MLEKRRGISSFFAESGHWIQEMIAGDSMTDSDASEAVLVLSSVVGKYPSSSASPLLVLWENEWELVSEKLTAVFAKGGSVTLAAATEVKRAQDVGISSAIIVDRNTERRYAELDKLEMYGWPQRFGLLAIPAGAPTRSFRTWWSGGEFRGKERFVHDDEWDSRAICCDIEVAKDLFSDFYQHKGISERILAATVLNSDLSDD